LKKIFKKKELTAYEAISEAQKIAYAPLIFQAARTMRDLGILEVLDNHKDQGLTAEDIAASLDISVYGVETLIESGLSSGIVEQNDDDRFVLSKVGHFLLHDNMTRINMDYNHHICYLGMFYLDKSILEERPAGLRVFGSNWETLYQALPHLPDPIRSSWYSFDHFYSDSAYPKALEIVLGSHPQTLVDIGANIGKFTVLAAENSSELKITMIDLPDQLKIAEQNIQEHGLEDRVASLSLDMLSQEVDLPPNQDVYWMSQFLSCFGEDEIINILRNTAKAMGPESRLFILETCWDNQEHSAAAYSLINTSLYFTCMASGNSKMYSSERLLEYISSAGLTCTNLYDNLGICHTLFECKKI